MYKYKYITFWFPSFKQKKDVGVPFFYLWFKIKTVNVKSGFFTYSQRIELSQILTGEKTDHENFIAVMTCFLGFTPSIKQYKKIFDYFTYILKSLTFWAEIEQRSLKYIPTTEEINAGIEDLAKNCGVQPTLYSLSRSFGADPDEILKWKYAKIFNILVSDANSAKYQKKYNDIMMKKNGK